MPPIHVYHETIEGKCYECCAEKRKRKSWLKNDDDGWIKFVPSSFAKLVYIYIYFSLTCISRFCLQKLVTDFSRNTAFRKKTLLNYLFFFSRKHFFPREIVLDTNVLETPVNLPDTSRV